MVRGPGLTFERRYPCLFECRDGSTYLVLEDPSKLESVELARSVVLRLDGEPTSFADTSKVFYTMTMDILDGMDDPWQDY